MLGDIALIHDRSKVSAISVRLQRAVIGDADAPPYTHAALIVGDYKIVHAMPAPEHVGFTLTYELLSPKAHWTVWRHRHLSRSIETDANLAVALLWKAEQYVGERYNNPLLQLPTEHHSFCSELIGKAFQDFGFRFSEQPEALLPMMIARHIGRDRQWVEVTEDYRRSLESDPRYLRLYDLQNVKRAKREQRALRAAKRIATAMSASLTEAIEGVNRFGRWTADEDKEAVRVWTLKDPRAQRDVPEDAVEWFSLFALDEVNYDLVKSFIRPVS